MVVEDIKKFPQTYETIFGGKVTNCSNAIVMKRKLSNLVSEGHICKTSIPGTRFGRVIFYAIPKPYSILITAGRMGSKVFCFFKHKKQGTFHLVVEECWELNEGMWDKLAEPKVFFEGDVLKWV